MHIYLTDMHNNVQRKYTKTNRTTVNDFYDNITTQFYCFTLLFINN